MTDTDAAYTFLRNLCRHNFLCFWPVEMAINKDDRMQEERMKSAWKWLTLSRKVLSDAHLRCLPVSMLLNSEEVDRDCVFVLRRNKVVH